MRRRWKEGVGEKEESLKTERRGKRRKLVFTQRLDAVTLVVS